MYQSELYQPEFVLVSCNCFVLSDWSHVNLIVPIFVVSVHGITLSVNISGNNVQLPTTGHHNESRLPNITSNELTAKTTAAQTTVIKTRTTNIPKTRTIDDMLDGYEGGKASSSNLTTSASTQLITTTQPLTRLSTHVENYTTVSPPHGAFKHHFNMKTLDYILIPVGCLLAIVILYFLVSFNSKSCEI